MSLLELYYALYTKNMTPLTRILNNKENNPRDGDQLLRLHLVHLKHIITFYNP